MIMIYCRIKQHEVIYLIYLEQALWSRILFMRSCNPIHYYVHLQHWVATYRCICSSQRYQHNLLVRDNGAIVNLSYGWNNTKWLIRFTLKNDYDIIYSSWQIVTWSIIMSIPNIEWWVTSAYVVPKRIRTPCLWDIMMQQCIWTHLDIFSCSETSRQNEWHVVRRRFDKPMSYILISGKLWYFLPVQWVLFA